MARVLETIANDAESKLIITKKKNLLEELLKLICPENESSIIEARLSCLIRISMPKRARSKLVQLGAIKLVAKLILNPNPSSMMSIIEKSLKVMETMSSSKEGRSQICDDVACIAAIVQKVLKVSSVAKEHAVTILWSMCYLFCDQKAQDVVAKANGLTKIFLCPNLERERERASKREREREKCLEAEKMKENENLKH